MPFCRCSAPRCNSQFGPPKARLDDHAQKTTVTAAPHRPRTTRVACADTPTNSRPRTFEYWPSSFSFDRKGGRGANPTRLRETDWISVISVIPVTLPNHRRVFFTDTLACYTSPTAIQRCPADSLRSICTGRSLPTFWRGPNPARHCPTPPSSSW